MDTKELESLEYKAPTTEKLGKESYKSHHFEQTVKSSTATLGLNSAVIKPEMRVNNSNVADQLVQPNQSLMIIEEIEGLISKVNDKLWELPVAGEKRTTIIFRNEAIETIDLFQKTTLFELRRVFE